MSLKDINRSSVPSVANVQRVLLSDRVFPYLLLLPAFVVLFVIYVYPIGRIFWFSFTDIGLITGGEFVGWENYKTLVDLDGEFAQTIWRTAIWTSGSVFPATLIGLGAALALRRNFLGRELFLGILLIPWTFPLAIVGFTWLMMYNSQFGFLNVAAQSLGIVDSPISFLSRDNAMASVIVARIWRAVPFAALIYYARLKAIPEHLYDAAKMDGAGAWAQYRYITMPELARVTAIIVILTTVWTTLIFDIVFTMTGGGPVNATKILPIDIYETTFRSFELGMASAKAAVTVVLLVFVTIVYWQFSDIEE